MYKNALFLLKNCKYLQWPPQAGDFAPRPLMAFGGSLAKNLPNENSWLHHWARAKL